MYGNMTIWAVEFEDDKGKTHFMAFDSHTLALKEYQELKDAGKKARALDMMGSQRISTDGV